MAQVVGFITSSTGGEQQDVLAAVRALPGVADVVPLAPGTTVPELARLQMAMLQDDADATETASRIRALPGILAADLPADRGLPW